MKTQAEGVSDIIPHHIIEMPDPQVLMVNDCVPYDVEMVIRGYITGSLWRDYTAKGPEKAGEQYGIVLPAGLRESQKFEEPIVTPTTKAKPEPGSKESHHDEPVSKDDIVSQVLLKDIKGVGKKGETNPFYIPEPKYNEMEQRTIAVFKRGQELALRNGLLLVDTKYEFGDSDGELNLIDEVHTPDSSRFWYAEPYKERFGRGEEQKSMSKEFVRKWLIGNGYDKAIGEASLKDLTDEIITETAIRYIELDELLTGKKFEPGDMSKPLEDRIFENLGISGWM
jgi:phosphoribosylaminoimidazole-succinocarboxamide synthase